jgi:hypothetical protein
MDIAQRVGRRRLRKEADSWIAAGFAPRFRWRVEELTSRRERRSLARSVRGVVADLSPRRLPGPVPVNRVALRPHVELLLALAERLADVDRPVTAAGIVEVRRLLTDPDGPLYTREPCDVERELARVLERLVA